MSFWQNYRHKVDSFGVHAVYLSYLNCLCWCCCCWCSQTSDTQQEVCPRGGTPPRGHCSRQGEPTHTPLSALRLEPHLLIDAIMGELHPKVKGHGQLSTATRYLLTILCDYQGKVRGHLCDHQGQVRGHLFDYQGQVRGHMCDYQGQVRGHLCDYQGQFRGHLAC